jgi:hypothetical protein
VVARLSCGGGQSSRHGLGLTGRHVAWRIVPVLGIPAVARSLLGAWLLLRVADAAPWLQRTLDGRDFALTPVKLLVGCC